MAGAAPLAAFLGLWALFVNFVSSGDPSPLPYVPILNPLDLAQIGAVLAIALWFVEVGASADRYWLVKVDQRGGGAGPLGFSAGWVPHRLVFALRGTEPFQLAYGSRDAKSAAGPPRASAFSSARRV